jgi:hypothetical protein
LRKWLVESLQVLAADAEASLASENDERVVPEEIALNLDNWIGASSWRAFCRWRRWKPFER